MILSKANPPSENRSRLRAAAAVLGALLLAGCWPTSPPPEDTLSPAPIAPPPRISGGSKTFAGLDLPLDPLASRDQVLRSFQSGRRDPFSNILVFQKMPIAKAAEAEAEAAAVAVGTGPVGTGAAGAVGTGAAGSAVSAPGGASRRGKDAACDSVLSTIQVKGLIYGAGSSEAIVVNALGETGSLRTGDRGGRSTSLIPLGCQVQSIDVNSGYLVIAPVQKGRPVKLSL